MTKNKLPIVTIYSFGHFYVDFICSFVLSLIIFQNRTSIISIASLIVMYNLIAFGTQPFFGFLIDQSKKPKLGAIIGLIFSTAGLLLFSKPFIATLLLGIGNAIYHVGGGIIVLNLEPSKAKYPGIYVAPGALGLFIGGVLGYLQIKPLIFLALGLIISITLILIIQNLPIQKIPKFKDKKTNSIGIILLLLSISICMRALIDFSLKLGWKSLLVLGLTLTIATVLGKSFGGFLADKYGFMKVGLIGLIISAPPLVFFQSVPVLVFIGAFCFNLVMPITLTAITETIPNYKGFGFGLTTLALVVGYLLYLILKNHILIGQTFTAIVIFINIGTLYLGLKKYEERKNEK